MDNNIRSVEHSIPDREKSLPQISSMKSIRERDEYNRVHNQNYSIGPNERDKYSKYISNPREISEMYSPKIDKNY